MFSQPNLSQSKQPNAHYDYDGLSGGWLWLPWWVHIGIALLIWPVCWWGLPLLPFQNLSISAFLSNYKIQIASAISILTVMTALLSYLKAYRIRRRKLVSRKTSVEANQAKSTAQAKTKKRIKSVQKTEEQISSGGKSVKNKKKLPSSAQNISKASSVKTDKKAVAKTKVKRSVKKKNDQQTQLDF